MFLLGIMNKILNLLYKIKLIMDVVFVLVCSLVIIVIR